MIKINNELYVQRDKVTFVSVTNNAGVVGLITKPDISCTIADAMTVVDAMGDDLLDLGTGVYICKQNVQYINLDYNEYLIRLTPSLIVKSSAEVFEYLKEYENKGSGGGGIEVVDELPEVGEEGKIYQLSTNGGLYKCVKEEKPASMFDTPITFKREISQETLQALVDASTVMTEGYTFYCFGDMSEPHEMLPEETPIIMGSPEKVMAIDIRDYSTGFAALYAIDGGWIDNMTQEPLDNPPTVTLPSNPWYMVDESLLAQVFDINLEPVTVYSWERIDTLKNVDTLPTEGDPEVLYKLPNGDLYSFAKGSNVEYDTPLKFKNTISQEELETLYNNTTYSGTLGPFDCKIPYSVDEYNGFPSNDIIMIMNNTEASLFMLQIAIYTSPDDMITYMYDGEKWLLEGSPIDSPVITLKNNAYYVNDFNSLSVLFDITPSKWVKVNGINYYQVEFHDDKFYHDGEELDYAKLVEVMDEQTKFLWLSLDNLVYIPNITIDGQNGALAFSTTFVRNDGSQDDPNYQPYISRIIINSQNVVGFEEFQLQRADETPSGGELYLHSITIRKESHGSISLDIINSSNVSIDSLTKLSTYLKDNGYTSNRNLKTCSGIVANSDRYVIIISGLYSTSGSSINVVNVWANDSQTSTIGESTNIGTFFDSTTMVYDVVKKIN